MTKQTQRISMTIIEKLKFKWEILFEEHIRLAWDDFINKYFIFPWERFQNRRRKRNPELVELDAFCETVRPEKKLKDYPNAVPLLTALMAAYKITGEEERKKFSGQQPSRPWSTSIKNQTAGLCC